MERAPRSMKVHPAQLNRVKAAYGRSDCFNQKDLADELGMSLDTLSKFLNGKPVARANASEICRRLSLDSDEILILGNAEVETLEASPCWVNLSNHAIVLPKFQSETSNAMFIDNCRLQPSKSALARL